jgi:GT2 family glycosyltransferase
MEPVSILVCSRGRRSTLEKLVLSLRKMDTSYRTEVVVVEETDNPSPLNGVRYISHPIANRGFPYARNLAVANASGNIIVFLDDDCVISDGWLNHLLSPLKDSSVVGAQGGVTVPPSSGPIGWAESIIGFPGGGIRRIILSGGRTEPTTEISTLNAAYRRRVVEAVGGFDERLKWGGEDDFLAKKACKHGLCLFVPTAAVAHKPRGSIREIWKWFVRRGLVDIFFTRIKDYKASKRYTHFTVLRSSLSIKSLLLVSVLCFFPSGWSLPLILFFFSLYILAQQVRYFTIWRKSGAGLPSFLLIPIVKLTMDFAADWGRFKGMFRG